MTSSLRSLIEAKSRRTATLPIDLGNAAAAAAEVSRASAALAEHLGHAHEPAESTEESLRFEQRTTELRAALAAATEAAAATVAEVTLQSLPADEWEALFGDLEPDASGEVPLDSCRAAMLAASCVDADLRDVEWWSEQLARPTWTKGDKLRADDVLLTLNVATPSAAVTAAGKG